MTGGPETADVVIVGAGASGAAAAWALSGHGLKIVCLEQGDWVDQSSSPSLDSSWEIALQTVFHPNPNIRAGTRDYPVTDDATPIKPALFNAVGGSTIRWGAHFPRLHPSDFRVRTLDGVAGDWPVTYPELEPYFDINDRMMGVAGLAGDPANPPRADRPTGPLPLCPATRRIAAAFDSLGWHWWPSDAAIVSVSYGDGRKACNNCGPCGLGCPRRSRASTDITYWPVAIRGGVDLRTRCVVTALKTTSSHQVGSVAYVDGDGHRCEISAGTVIVGCNGLGTSRLLLASASRRHRTGLANSSGQLGRNLMLHPTAIVTGVFAERLDSHRGPFATSLYSQQFYETDGANDFIRGYQLQALRGQGPVGTALGGYMHRLPWGETHHRQFMAEFGHSVSLTVTTEDLPEPVNRVELDRDRKDAWGLPVPKMTYRLGENTRRMLSHGTAKAREVMATAGASEIIVNPLARQAGFHFLGTARMGDDPETSVVNGDCVSHDIDNLMIVDGSVFPTSAAVNPTPTIQAVALRAADRLLHRLGISEGPRA
ncbi:MAG: GMC family oxidoreductase [Rhodospirillales bacterium]